MVSQQRRNILYESVRYKYSECKTNSQNNSKSHTKSINKLASPTRYRFLYSIADTYTTYCHCSYTLINDVDSIQWKIQAKRRKNRNALMSFSSPIPHTHTRTHSHCILLYKSRMKMTKIPIPNEMKRKLKKQKISRRTLHVL